MTPDDILTKLKDIFSELFDISPDRVSLETKMFEELGLDSIDAVDLVVKLQTLTGQRIAPQDFKSVRTVGDVVTCIEKLMHQNEPAQS